MALITIHNHIHLDGVVNELVSINIKLNKIIMTNAELATKLDAANTKVDKIITEIQALKVLVGTTPDVPQNIVDAVNTLEAKLQAADDLNDDAPQP